MPGIIDVGSSAGRGFRCRGWASFGGIAPESTIEYYRQLVSLYRERTGHCSYPSIVINSIDLNRLLDAVGAGRLGELADYLVAELGRLAAAGADVALLASNTPHIVFDEVRSRCPIPLLSIVETVLNRRRLWNPLAKAMWVTGSVVSVSRHLARSRR